MGRRWKPAKWALLRGLAVLRGAKVGDFGTGVLEGRHARRQAPRRSVLEGR